MVIGDEDELVKQPGETRYRAYLAFMIAYQVIEEFYISVLEHKTPILHTQ